MKIENGILYFSERLFDEGTKCSAEWSGEVLTVEKNEFGNAIENNTLLVGGLNGDYNYKTENGKLILTKKNLITPEIIKNPLDKARRIMGMDKDLSEISKDDILEKIFDLAHECQNSDPKEAVAFRVAIDAFQWLYDEIRKQPPKKITNEIDASDSFLKEWGIK